MLSFHIGPGDLLHINKGNVQLQASVMWENARVCRLLEPPLWSSAGSSLCYVCVWKANVFQFFKSCSSVLPLYFVCPPTTAVFIFGRASRASMEMGRRAVCAQPGHLAAQRGRGRGGRWSRGRGSGEENDFLFSSPVFIFIFLLPFVASSTHYSLILCSLSISVYWNPLWTTAVFNSDTLLIQLPNQELLFFVGALSLWLTSTSRWNRDAFNPLGNIVS